MKKKTCRDCGEKKVLAEFPSHPNMSDGHLNSCKACRSQYMRLRRINESEAFAEIDRARKDDPRRIKQRREWKARYKEKYPEKMRAHAAVGRAVKRGSLIVQPCEVCGTECDVQAHHEDYEQPLDVRWLCRTHHKEEHAR